MKPRVAIQFIAYWSEEASKDIDVAMESLTKLVYPRESLRLVVVDNPSPHGTARAQFQEKWLNHPDLPEIVFVESEENDGYAGGHTRGYEAVRSFEPDYLYLLNQDASMKPDALEHIVEYAEANMNTSVVQSKVVSAQSPEQVDSYGNALHFLGYGYQDPDGHRAHFYLSGAAILIRTASLEAMGGLFDPDFFMYHDDVDLCWRARLAGFDLATDTGSVAYHRYEFSRSIGKFYWMERNRLRTHATNLKWRTLALLAPMMLVMEAGTFLFALKGGWWQKKLAAYGYFLKLSTWADLFERRRLIASIRRVDDKDLLPLMVSTIEAQAVANPVLDHLVNPAMTLYWRLVRPLVRW